MTWFTERRLDFIDWCLAIHGEVQRNDLVTTFDISVPQASGDLGNFMRLYPKAMKYDATAKRYVPARTPYKPQRGAPSGAKWL
jgi:hypothetical protein